MYTDIKFSEFILNWFNKFGRKNLPWQINKDPYKIWISEIMLQQTQVKTVIPYFYRFMKNFPTIYHLSNASLDEVLFLWSGLGYYKRADNLYKSAKLIVQKFKKKFPSKFEQLIQLPGIGRSTAHAILSFSMQKKFSVLDGNVKRVLSRYYNISKAVGEKNRLFWKIIEKLTPAINSDKFNQAMMDIGSLICTSHHPKCIYCPVKKKCMSYKNGVFIDSSKKKLTKKIIKNKIWFFLLIINKKKIWLEKRCSSGIWPNLFCFPQFESQKKLKSWLKHFSSDDKIKILKSFLHVFSHFSLKIVPIVTNISNIKKNIFHENDGIWYNLTKPQKVGLSIPVKKLLNDIIV
ncbi:A/G-specific adenine glycosylase [Candidatus Tachikawaea gelatinosa]|uniref:Adenine DNA glycosylase n=1 Tax=Candidatus Tachikawaea gelatinosa TaxID=1410383 RepID=A0A090BWI4_9ENTR|nr:A/G-specific adenine glycosylase [Candidatus Tachikawaea gelatinosa]BAP58661.1 A/G-specific DNA-adenine glycosylase [Candidatus Tachikawaea gelatinosa]